eukprot:5675053-Pleurochrysis_carterae.AAC.3
MKSQSQSKERRPRLRVRSLWSLDASDSRSMMSSDCCLIMAGASVSSNCWLRARRSCSLISTINVNIGVVGGSGDASNTTMRRVVRAAAGDSGGCRRPICGLGLLCSSVEELCTKGQVALLEFPHALAQERKRCPCAVLGTAMLSSDGRISRRKLGLGECWSRSRRAKQGSALVRADAAPITSPALPTPAPEAGAAGGLCT